MRLLNLGTALGWAGLVAAWAADNAHYTYEFNAVAVTGGGYITGLIAHPAEKNLMYARTDIGSTYRWNETLNKWIPLTDFVSEADSNLLGSESVALDPVHPARLYLAQGRYLTSNNSAFFVSDDRGETFNLYPAPFPMGSNELGRNNGERLAVNPFNSDELYMGTRTAGLWKSSNRAQTWNNVTSFPNAYANTIGISFVIFDPHNNGTIYAGATAPGGMYRSTDGGASWTPLTGQPISWNGTLVRANATGPQSIAPQPMKAVLSSNGVLYITYADAPGPYGVDYGAVYSYDTVTQTWRDITPNGNNSMPPPYEPQAFPNGGFCGISVAADDSDTLVVTSLDRDPGPAIDSLYLSRDGGSSWVDVAQLSTPDRNASGGYWGHPIAEAVLANGTAVPWLSFDWSKEWGGYGAPSPVYGLTKFGWWMTALLVSPWDSEKVMYGTGTTIWASDDVLSASSRWSAPGWHVQAQGIEETVCLAMISPREGAHLLSGFGDINGFMHADLNLPQPMFALPVYSNLNGLDWAGQQPAVIVRVGQNQLNNTPETGCQLGALSVDGGVNWTTFGTCQPLLNSTNTDAGTIALDATGMCLVWSAASISLEGSNPMSNESGPYYSLDRGDSWKSPTGLHVQTPNITSDKVQNGTFYSYTDGVWYLSTDGGQTYVATHGTDIDLPESSGALPVVDFAHAGYVYLPLGQQGIYHTSDFGSSWTRVSGEGVWPSLLTVGAPAPGRDNPALYIWGTISVNGTTGLYRSDDNGAGWVRVNDDAHQYGGPGLIQGDPRVYGRVYIGTGGRGIVRADVVASMNPTGGVVPGTGGI
ncbi:oligoxyloglucan reducing-end-specific cellobiohydrolase [Saitozyma sp. JCM 24511]|nr:oligoxyloglucan reducing-end-specific cellobiohydrolase [Saitozyma sp. JCM 24511]